MRQSICRLMIVLGAAIALVGCVETTNSKVQLEVKSDFICPNSAPDPRKARPAFQMVSEHLRDDGDPRQWLHLLHGIEADGPPQERFRTWLSGTVIPTCDDGADAIKWSGSLFGREEYAGCRGTTVYHFDIVLHDSKADCADLKDKLSETIFASIRDKLRERTGRSILAN